MESATVPKKKLQQRAQSLMHVHQWEESQRGHDGAFFSKEMGQQLHSACHARSCGEATKKKQNKCQVACVYAA